MENLNIEEMILRQSKGQLSATETKSLREWYDQSAENRKLYSDCYSILKVQSIIADSKMFESDLSSAWLRLDRRIRSNRLNIKWRPLLNYAAVALVAFFLGFWILQGLMPTVETHPVSIVIPNGSKSKIVLPDGTAVWLNSGTRLSYGSDFGAKNRLVYMEGEGYFSVTKNKKLPFVIVSGKTHIQVLGTKFNMKAYPGDEQTRVTLLEGSLKVGRGNISEGVVIKPNQQAILKRGSPLIAVHDVKATDYILWTSEKRENVATIPDSHDKQLPLMKVPSASIRTTLLFDEVSLYQISRDLSRAFNVDIRMATPDIASRVYYGDFRNDETLYQILDIITSSGDIHYEIRGNTIWICK